MAKPLNERIATRRSKDAKRGRNILYSLRRECRVDQRTMAAALHCSQPNVSKVETQGGTAIKISTLTRYASTLGGTLEITVTFPNGDQVRLNELE